MLSAFGLAQSGEPGALGFLSFPLFFGRVGGGSPTVYRAASIRPGVCLKPRECPAAFGYPTSASNLTPKVIAFPAHVAAVFQGKLTVLGGARSRLGL